MMLDKTIYKYPLHCGIWLESIDLKEYDFRHCKQCHKGDYGVNQDHGPFFRIGMNGHDHGNNLVVCCQVATICTK